MVPGTHTSEKGLVFEAKGLCLGLGHLVACIMGSGAVVERQARDTGIICHE